MKYTKYPTNDFIGMKFHNIHIDNLSIINYYYQPFMLKIGFWGCCDTCDTNYGESDGNRYAQIANSNYNIVVEFYTNFESNVDILKGEG